MDTRLKMTPKLAIIGRPNVGKSTLFNKIIGRRRALESAIAGTTTDMNFALGNWRGKVFTIIDTAGLDLSSNAATETSLKRQVNLAIAKADVLVFVADAIDGLTLPDRNLAKELKKTTKPIIFAINKVDGPKNRFAGQNPDWQKLGMGDPILVSGTTGAGTGDLLDVAVEQFEKLGILEQELPSVDARVALIGKPNVGKSSIMNRLAGDERVIVSEIPHTTKEPQDTLISYIPDENPTSNAGELEEIKMKNLLFVDTVGIRKHASIQPGLETTGVILSLRELENSEVAILVLDATDGVNLQDKKISNMIEERSAGLIIAINKWDLAKEQNLGSAEVYSKYLALKFPFLEGVPVVFISALTGRSIDRLIPMTLKLIDERNRQISSEDLDAFTVKLKKMHPTKAKGLNRPKIYGISQNYERTPPTFTIVVDDKDKLHPNFLKFIKKQLREEYGFTGTPVRLMGREIDGWYEINYWARKSREKICLNTSQCRLYGCWSFLPVAKYF